MTPISHHHRAYDNFRTHSSHRNYNNNYNDNNVNRSQSSGFGIGDALLVLGAGATAIGIGSSEGKNVGEKTGNFFKNFFDQSKTNLHKLFGKKEKEPTKLETPLVGLTPPPAPTTPTKLPASLTTPPAPVDKTATNLITSASTTLNKLVPPPATTFNMFAPQNLPETAPAAAPAVTTPTPGQATTPKFNMFASPLATSPQSTPATPLMLTPPSLDVTRNAQWSSTIGKDTTNPTVANSAVSKPLPPDLTSAEYAKLPNLPAKDKKTVIKLAEEGLGIKPQPSTFGLPNILSLFNKA